MKKIISFCLALAICLSLCVVSTAETNPSKHKYGDLTSDGKVMDIDVVMLFRYIANWDVIIDMQAADVDRNNKVEDKDAILLARWYANWKLDTCIGQEIENYKIDLKVDVENQISENIELGQRLDISYTYNISGTTLYKKDPSVLVSYSSSNPETISIKDNEITAMKMGISVITVKVTAYFEELDFTYTGYGYTTVNVEDTKSKKILISENKETKYTIAYSEDSLYEYAHYLSDTLKSKTGADFDISEPFAIASDYEIILQTGEAKNFRGIDDDLSEYRSGGYHIFIKDNKIIVSCKDSAGIDKAVRYLSKYYINSNGNMELPKNMNIFDSVGAAVKEFTIAGNDISEYVIVKPEICAETMNYAASQLTYYIKLATGKEIPVVTKKPENTDKIINLIVDTTAKYITDENGNVVISKAGFLSPAEYGILESDGYSMNVSGNTLTIEGGARGGNLNGVYDLLEKYIGWKFLDGEVTEITPSTGIDIPEGTSNKVIPTFEYRAVKDYNFSNPDYLDNYTAPRKINGTEVAPQLQSSKYGSGLGRAKYNAHSFYDFINEYYYDNIRIRGSGTQKEGKDLYFDTQPCLSNEDNFNEFMTKITNFIEDRKINYALGEPGLQQISVGWNDNDKYCHNSACRAIISEENDSEAGPYVRFVNKVQQAVNKDYPDLEIFMLAYWGALKPTETKLNDNVVVCYCWGASNHAIADTGFEDKTRDQNVEYYLGWIENAPKVYEWYYCTNFTWYMAPLPILSYLGQDMKFFAETGCKGIYAEARDDDNAYAFESLVEYMIARSMWNPYMSDADYNNDIDVYMQSYFGDGWNYLREYIEMWEQAGRLAGEWPEMKEPQEIFDLDYYGDSYYNMCELFDKAEAMANTKEQQYRIQTARCHMEFLGLSGLYRKYDTFTEQQKSDYAERYHALYDFMMDNDINVLNKNDTGAGKGWMADYKDTVTTPLAWVNIKDNG